MMLMIMITMFEFLSKLCNDVVSTVQVTEFRM